MAAAIALLRGINLGARRVSSADLRAAFESLGLGMVRTLQAAGSLVFTGSGEDPEDLEARAAQALSKRLGFDCEVFIRCAKAWDEMIAANPFAEAARHDPAHLLAMVLKRAPKPEAAGALTAAISGPEQARIVGRCAYIVYPDGMGRSSLTGGRLDRALEVRGTGRNWKTVLKLAEMAAAGP
ncbi:MAG TPA: DUF1697 domain-containing protein [Caulobacteraceae bacterium]|nr:DUF1697 domain-containing protein [Caulobacteraceae bacterium]